MARPSWHVRRLQQADLSAFRPLRLAALRDHPEAFGVSYEEELMEDTARLIAQPPGLTLGGFVGERLVGCAVLTVSPRVKQRHRGHVVSVYVAPDERGGGLGQGLLDGLITHARSAGLLILTLSVTLGNDDPRRLYHRAGFRPYGVEPGSLRIGADLLDAELMALRLD